MKKSKSMNMMKDYWPDSDAHTLAQAKAIMSDKKRYMEAAKAASKMQAEMQAKAKAMSAIARSGKKK